MRRLLTKITFMKTSFCFTSGRKFEIPGPNRLNLHSSLLLRYDFSITLLHKVCFFPGRGGEGKRIFYYILEYPSTFLWKNFTVS
jgi:hypothetical protein